MSHGHTFKPDRLRYWRENRFLTQEELGAIAGITYSQISRIETGRNAPSLRTIKRLAAALGVEPSELTEKSEYHLLAS